MVPGGNTLLNSPPSFNSEANSEALGRSGNVTNTFSSGTFGASSINDFMMPLLIAFGMWVLMRKK